MLLLDNPVRHYDWGSTTAIPGLLGRPADGRPWAELWLGAHPAAPSTSPAGETLADIVAVDPERALGRACVRRHGASLPYLLKLVAAARPLSIQVHPDRDRAAAGFSQEEAAGVSPDDPCRTFRDPHHKPEMLLALGRFRACCGFRGLGPTRAMLGELDAPVAGRLLAVLGGGGSDEGAVLRRAVGEVLREPWASDASALGRLAAECATRAGRPGRWATAWSVVAAVARAHPGDPGVLLTALLNDVVLESGEALFVPPGTVHCYVDGLGVEVMAASDNVVRAALTTKHTDVALLAELTSWRPEPPVPVRPAVRSAAVRSFRAEATEFELLVVEPVGGEPTAVHAAGPRIVLALAGGPVVAAGGEELSLRAGEAVFVPACDGALRVAGPGRLVVAAVPED